MVCENQMADCVVENCVKPSRARRMCSAHYRAAYRAEARVNTKGVNTKESKTVIDDVVVDSVNSRAVNTVNKAAGNVGVDNVDTVGVDVVDAPRSSSPMPSSSTAACVCRGDNWNQTCRNSTCALKPRPGDYLGGPVTW